MGAGGEEGGSGDMASNPWYGSGEEGGVSSELPAKGSWSASMARC